jgi:hypothetical protein
LVKSGGEIAGFEEPVTSSALGLPGIGRQSTGTALALSSIQHAPVVKAFQRSSADANSVTGFFARSAKVKTSPRLAV